MSAGGAGGEDGLIPYAEELRRLDSGAEDGDGFTVVFEADCPTGAGVVLERVREGMRAVVSVLCRDGGWPDDDAWARLLPAWFVAACGPELSDEEAQALQERWQSLPPDERDAEEDRQPWTLDGWVYWFDPDGGTERQWRWLGGRVTAPDRIQVTLESDGWPNAFGAFVWLLQTAGAERVRYPV